MLKIESYSTLTFLSFYTYIVFSLLLEIMVKMNSISYLNHPKTQDVSLLACSTIICLCYTNNQTLPLIYNYNECSQGLKYHDIQKMYDADILTAVGIEKYANPKVTALAC